MDKLISSEALREAMYHEAFEIDTPMQKWDSGCWIRFKLFERVVDSMPVAELAWIPCSERLPKICDSYIVTVEMKYPFEKEWLRFTDVAYIDTDGVWELCNDLDEGQEIHIIAWMPLPDSWKGDKK